MSDGSRWSLCWSVSCVKLCCNGSCIVKWWFEPRQKPSICSWNRYNCDWCCFKRLHGRNNASLLKARSLSTSSRMIIPIRFFWSFLSFCSYTALQFQRNLFFKLDFFSNNFSTDLHSLGTNKKNRKQTVWQFITDIWIRHLHCSAVNLWDLRTLRYCNSRVQKQIIFHTSLEHMKFYSATVILRTHGFYWILHLWFLQLISGLVWRTGFTGLPIILNNYWKKEL